MGNLHLCMDLYSDVVNVYYIMPQVLINPGPRKILKQKDFPFFFLNNSFAGKTRPE